jgi:hypothetical protein
MNENLLLSVNTIYFDYIYSYTSFRYMIFQKCDYFGKTLHCYTEICFRTIVYECIWLEA